MHRPVQSGGRRSTAVSQTTETRCVTHDTSLGQPFELPQTRKENDSSMLARHDAHWTLWKVVDFVLVSSFRKTRRPIKPRTMRHSIYHEDASPPRPLYGFKVYCSRTGTVLVVGTLTMPTGKTCRGDVERNSTSHPRHRALGLKRPRGGVTRHHPVKKTKECCYTSTSPMSSWRTQDRSAFTRITPRLPAFFLRRYKEYKT